MKGRVMAKRPDVEAALKALGIQLAGVKVLKTVIPGHAEPVPKVKRKPRRPLPADALLERIASDPRCWEVTIPGWHPTRLNQLIHAHRGKSSRLKFADALRIGRTMRGAGVPRATGRRRMGLVIILGPRQRGGDPDAYDKSSRDGLKRCGAIVDDNRQWLEPLPTQYERGPERATRIILEDA